MTGLRPGLIKHLDKLPLLLKVVDLGSFARAADAVGVAQPSVSHAIKALETAVGAELCVRTSRGIEATPAGRALYAFAKRLIDDVGRAERELALALDGDAASMAIGTKETYAVALWPTYLRALRDAQPKLDITLHTTRSNAELLRLLVTGHLDIAMLPDTPKPEGLVAYPLFRDAFAFYATPSLRGSRDRRPWPILLFRGALAGDGRRLGDIVDDLVVPALRIHSVDSYHLARAMMLQGLGVALLPASFAAPDLATRAIAAVTIDRLDQDAFGSVQVCLCISRQNAKNKRLRAVMQTIRARHRSMDAWLYV
jgi:DNA-binding transcriptional LysR family regulator